MITTYKELAAICDAPKQVRHAAIFKHAKDVERIIAEQAMGATLVDNIWEIDDTGGTRFPKILGAFDVDDKWHAFHDWYRPLIQADRALAAMDKMIERGWSFEPHWNGLDFSAVGAINYNKGLTVQALHWSRNADRHATALSLAVALACLLEKENA